MENALKRFCCACDPFLPDFHSTIPLAWYELNRRLQEDEYRTDISWWIFAVRIWCVEHYITYREFSAIKAALMNPEKEFEIRMIGRIKANGNK